MNVQPTREPSSLLPEPFERWFAGRGWSPRADQLELLARAQAGRSVLLIAPTGAGKTLAGVLPSLVELSTVEQWTRSAPSPTDPGHARGPHQNAQIGQARLALAEGGGGGSTQTRASPIPHSLSLPHNGGGNVAARAPSDGEFSESGRKLISTGRSLRREGGLHTLYISPLKALAVDIARNLETPVAEMALP